MEQISPKQAHSSPNLQKASHLGGSKISFTKKEIKLSCQLLVPKKKKSVARDIRVHTHMCLAMLSSIF